MEKQSGTDETHVFSIRLWQEEIGAGRWEWRGKVRNALSGEARYFRDWDTLVAFVQADLADSAQWVPLAPLPPTGVQPPASHYDGGPR